MMTRTSKIAYFFISAAFFILFDIYFSNLVIDSLEELPVNPVFDLVFVQNTGAAFSILSNSKVFLTAFALIAILGIAVYLIKHIKRISVFTIFWSAMLVAGIFCNMYERLHYGYVKDCFKLNFISFPVFNISDIFINISVFAIVVIIIKNNYFKKNNETNSR